MLNRFGIYSNMQKHPPWSPRFAVPTWTENPRPERLKSCWQKPVSHAARFAPGVKPVPVAAASELEVDKDLIWNTASFFSPNVYPKMYVNQSPRLAFQPFTTPTWIRGRDASSASSLTHSLKHRSQLGEPKKNVAWNTFHHFSYGYGLLFVREISEAGSTCHDFWNFSLGLGDLGHELLILPIPRTTMLEDSRPSNTNHEPGPIKKEQQKTTETMQWINFEKIRIPDTSPKRPCRSSWYPVWTGNWKLRRYKWAFALHPIQPSWSLLQKMKEKRRKSQSSSEIAENGNRSVKLQNPAESCGNRCMHPDFVHFHLSSLSVSVRTTLFQKMSCSKRVRHWSDLILEEQIPIQANTE